MRFCSSGPYHLFGELQLFKHGPIPAAVTCCVGGNQGLWDEGSKTLVIQQGIELGRTIPFDWTFEHAMPKYAAIKRVEMRRGMQRDGTASVFGFSDNASRFWSAGGNRTEFHAWSF